jgi:hypothetical protein
MLPAPADEILTAVGELPGVDRVTLDPDDVGLLRLDLHADAAEEAVMSVVEAMLRDRFGVVPSEARLVESTGPLSAVNGRLVVERLVLSSAGGAHTAEVVLTLDGRSAPGSAAGTGSLPAVTAVVSALLLALEELTEDAVIATIEDVTFSDGDETATVQLRLDVDGSDIVASGTAPLIAHRPQAVARAVLAAVEPHLPA